MKADTVVQVASLTLAATILLSLTPHVNANTCRTYCEATFVDIMDVSNCVQIKCRSMYRMRVSRFGKRAKELTQQEENEVQENSLDRLRQERMLLFRKLARDLIFGFGPRIKQQPMWQEPQ